jgi:hypothetical protein
MFAIRHACVVRWQDQLTPYTKKMAPLLEKKFLMQYIYAVHCL